MRKLQISAKCSDMFWGRLTEDGKELGEYSGEVPKFLGPDGYGDYVEMEIDVDSGQILNWKATKKDLKVFLTKNK